MAMALVIDMAMARQLYVSDSDGDDHGDGNGDYRQYGSELNGELTANRFRRRKRRPRQIVGGADDQTSNNSDNTNIVKPPKTMTIPHSIDRILAL